MCDTQEDPYKLSLFGKDPDYLEVVAADFLPDGDKLFILVADSDCNLHVLQYDPEGRLTPSSPIFPCLDKTPK